MIGCVSIHISSLVPVVSCTKTNKNNSVSFFGLIPGKAFETRQNRSISLLALFHPQGNAFYSHSTPPGVDWTLCFDKIHVCSRRRITKSGERINLFVAKPLNLPKHIALIRRAVICVLFLKKGKKILFFFLCMYFGKHILLLEHFMN